MATYAEYLKSQGASDEDIKVLDTPIARKAYERLEAAVVSASERADAEKRAMDEYKTSVREWNDTKIVPEFQDLDRKATLATANEARLLAAIKTSQDEGLKAVAKSMGYKLDDAPPPNAPPANTPPAPDMS